MGQIVICNVITVFILFDLLGLYLLALNIGSSIVRSESVPRHFKQIFFLISSIISLHLNLNAVLVNRRSIAFYGNTLMACSLWLSASLLLHFIQSANEEYVTRAECKRPRKC